LCSYSTWIESERETDKQARLARKVGAASRTGQLEAEDTRTASDRDRCENQVGSLLRRSSPTAQIRKKVLSQHMSSQKVREHLDDVLIDLVERNVIDIHPIKPGPHGGRPGTAYSWVR
jgi:hypothetical protein